MTLIVIHRVNERVQRVIEEDASIIIAVGAGHAVVRKNRTGKVGPVAVDAAAQILASHVKAGELTIDPTSTLRKPQKTAPIPSFRVSKISLSR